MNKPANVTPSTVPRRRTAGAPAAYLAATLLALFAIDNVLLLQFLGLSPPLTALMILLLCPPVAIMAVKTVKTDIVVPWRAIALAGLIATILFALGGQGRFFYANVDWQIRDAILADMTGHSWPFAYPVDGEAAILRAPIGLYLLPALIGGGLQEYAMLLSNALRLTLLIALCWPLFTRNRDRWIALIIFLLFSGLDLAGTALFDRLGVSVSWDHLERWNFNNQYSAHVTQAFWVPQHALAGWACAVGFLLWQRGLARIGLFAAIIPLVAIWSPLAIMGVIPFALLAGFSVLRTKDWDRRDVLAASLSLVIALPALAYLQADAAELASGARAIGFMPYMFLIAFEVVPFILPPLLSRRTAGRDRLTLWVIFACLLCMPLYQIGSNSDFQMRASIMPLALLALLFAQWVARLFDTITINRTALAYAAVIMAVGAATPMFEIRRALTMEPSPKPLCSLLGVWNQQDGLIIAPHATYFARTRVLPHWLPAIPVRAGVDEPTKCWERPWPNPEENAGKIKAHQ
jgi:hypothetical protein